MSRAAGFLGVCWMVALVAWAIPAAATDFHVLEAHAGYEQHLSGGVGDGHGSYGLGYVWDVFITHPTFRGVEVGGRVDLLHCPSCASAVDGGAVLGTALLTLWKDDLSTVTAYAGLAPGLGYSHETKAIFAEGELEVAVQFRALYAGLWVRPIVFLGAGGAYDGYASAGLRIAIGYSPNHGQRGMDEAPPAPRTGCDPPERAELPASQKRWSLQGCFRDGVAVQVDGRPVGIADQQGDLEIDVGVARAGSAQTVEIDIGGGPFSVRLERR
jgi:hypothetical protein